MKALIKKELRENSKLAALALVILLILLWQETRNVLDSIGRVVATGEAQWHLSPFLSQEFMLYMFWFCGLFGAALGFLQIFHERNRDLWSFLVHRPLTRTGLFIGKTVAGLTIYFAVAAVPMIALAFWAATPGHIPAPFELSMVLPFAGALLLGVLFYFAGMLTGLRRARWYVSRALPLGFALVLAGVALFVPEFREGLAIFAVAGAVLALAAWACFQSNGDYKPAPMSGKMAMTLSVGVGWGVVAFAIASMLTELLPRETQLSTWTAYGLLKDGTPYKLLHHGSGAMSVEALNGKPLSDPKSGEPLGVNSLDRLAVQAIWLVPDFNHFITHRLRYISALEHVCLAGIKARTAWYYSIRKGRLEGYDVVTRKFGGSIGPRGFSPSVTGAGDRFDYQNAVLLQGARVLRTPTELYRFDAQSRSLRQVFATTADDPIGAVNEVIVDQSEWQYVAVVTRHSIQLLTPEGKVLWKRPYEPPYPQYREVKLFLLSPPGNFALSIGPSDKANFENNWSLPTHLTWIQGENAVRTAELAPIRPPETVRSLSEILVSAAMAPLHVVVEPLFDSQPDIPFKVRWDLLLVSLAVAALICIPAGFVIGRRYAFTLGQQLTWALWHLISGLPGFLAFLSVRDWPARVPCPTCLRPRVVDRDRCEHCRAPFPAPERTGIEIFEELSSPERIRQEQTAAHIS